MNSIGTTMSTVATYSEDFSRRYLLQKTFDKSKPSLAIIMMAPAEADGIALDYTSMLVLNNSARLGYGSVSIVNLFATLDFDIKEEPDEDSENISAIEAAAKSADVVIFAPGTGKTKNKVFQKRQNQVLTVLKPFENKLYCLCDANGNARLQHPLSPSVRLWNLSKLAINELMPSSKESPVQKKENVTKGKKGAASTTTEEKPAKGRKTTGNGDNEITILTNSQEEPQTPKASEN